MGTLNKLFIFGFAILLLSCSKRSELEKAELIKWVENEDNHLTRKHVSGGLEYKAVICPVAYIVAKEVKSESVSESTLTLRKQDLGSQHYFKLRIRNATTKEDPILYHLNSEQEYKERLDYLSYGFEENLFLVRNNLKDTILPSLFHFERTYGITPYIDFVFCFPEDTAVKDNRLQLLINDVVFGNGLISYDFNKKDLLNTPNLKLN